MLQLEDLPKPLPLLPQKARMMPAATVKIDGRDYGEVDQYSFTGVQVGRMDQREVPFRWSVADLAPGKHTIEVTVAGRKNSASSGARINVAGLSAYQ